MLTLKICSGIFRGYKFQLNTDFVEDMNELRWGIHKELEMFCRLNNLEELRHSSNSSDFHIHSNNDNGVITIEELKNKESNGEVVYICGACPPI